MSFSLQNLLPGSLAPGVSCLTFACSSTSVLSLGEWPHQPPGCLSNLTFPFCSLPTHTMFTQTPRPLDSVCLIFRESPLPLLSIPILATCLPYQPTNCLSIPTLYSFLPTPLYLKCFSDLSLAENPAKAPNSLRIKPRHLITRLLLSLQTLHCSASHSTPSSRMNLCSLGLSCYGYFASWARRSRERSKKWVGRERGRLRTWVWAVPSYLPSSKYCLCMGFSQPTEHCCQTQRWVGSIKARLQTQSLLSPDSMSSFVSKAQSPLGSLTFLTGYVTMS